MPLAQAGEILVVGAGIAGLSLARALTTRGVACAVVERAAGPSTSGMGLNLPGNALQAIAQLGLHREITEHGVPIRRREYRNAAGAMLFAVDEESFWGGPSRCVRRGDLIGVLVEATAGVSIRWDTAVQGLEPAPTGVRVRLSSGQAKTFPAVVGADGVHSAVRHAIASATEATSSLMTTTSWRFITRNPGVDCWTSWSGKGETLLLIPIADGQVYGYAASLQHDAAGPDPTWLDTAFRTYPDVARAAATSALEQRETLLHSAVEEVRAGQWSSGRTLLIGDAAHATGPVWAQGAALGMEDALVLAELFATASDWDTVGARFEAVRRPRVQHVQQITDRMSWIARLPGWIRDRSAGFLGPKTFRAAYTPLKVPVLPLAPGS